MSLRIKIISNSINRKIPTILVEINQFRYIFNVTSNYYRHSYITDTAHSKYHHIFFTKNCIETISGLNDIITSNFYRTQTKQICIYSNRDFFKFLDQLKFSLSYKVFSCSYCSWEGSFQKGILEKSVIKQLSADKNFPHIFDNIEKSFFKNLQPNQYYNAFSYLASYRRPQISSSQPKSYYFKTQQISIIPFFIQENTTTITNYICKPMVEPAEIQTQRILNRLRIEKDSDEYFSFLKNKVFKSKSGQTFFLKGFQEPLKIARKFLILHLASSNSCQQIMKNEHFVNYLDDNTYTHTVVYIVEEPEIILSHQFKQLLSKFNNLKGKAYQTQNFVFNRFYRNTNFNASHIFQSQFHLLQNQILSKHFPNCFSDILKIFKLYWTVEVQKMNNIRYVHADHNIQIHRQGYVNILYPSKQSAYKFDQIQDLEESRYLNKLSDKIKEHKGITDSLKIQEKIKQEQTITNKLFDFGKLDPKIAFLGTGASHHTKRRNVSSIFLEWNQDLNIMLDCGDGTYDQLLNHFGPIKTEEILLNLQIIFITHVHSDHTLGIFSIISERNKLLKKYRERQMTGKGDGNSSFDGLNRKLTIIFPFNVLKIFHSYNSHIQNIMDGCDVLFTQTLMEENYDESQIIEKNFKDQHHPAPDCFQRDQLSAEFDQQQSIKTTPPPSSPIQKQKVESLEEERQNKAFRSIDLDRKEMELENFVFQSQSKYLKLIVPSYLSTQIQIFKKFKELLNTHGITSFKPLRVIHCEQSFGIVIEHSLSKIKISYSGDTLPSKQFAKAALNSTLMIHEASYPDHKIKAAAFTKHSTPKQAIQIGIESNSWKLALTHFMLNFQEDYKKTQKSYYSESSKLHKYFKQHTIYCSDHMQSTMSGLPTLSRVSHTIEQIHSEIWKKKEGEKNQK